MRCSAQHICTACTNQSGLHFPLFSISLCLEPLSTVLPLIHKIDNRLSSHCAVECQNLFLLCFGYLLCSLFSPTFPSSFPVSSSFYSIFFVQFLIYSVSTQDFFFFHFMTKAISIQQRLYSAFCILIFSWVKQYMVPCSLVMLGGEYSSQLARQSQGKTATLCVVRRCCLVGQVCYVHI